MSDLLAAVDDIATHVGAWTNLLRDHIAMLAEDLPPTAESDGTSDRSYAEHELRAMERDLGALLAAAERVRAATAAVHEAPMPDIVKPIARAIDPFPFQMLDLGTSGDRGALMREQAEEAERRARRVVTVLRENGWTAPSARS